MIVHITNYIETNHLDPNNVIGTPVYKDDTKVGEIIAVDPDTKEVTIKIDSMFDNWVNQVWDSGQSIGVSSRKIPKKL